MMQEEYLKRARILIIDDQRINLHVIDRLLGEAGFHQLKCLTDPREAVSACQEFQPDLILLDLHMPHLDGFAVMEQLQPYVRETYLPILVLTSDYTTDARKKALSGGAQDFLTKPFDPIEVVLRIRNLLTTRFLYLQLQDQNQALEERVKERTSELEAMNERLVQGENDKKQFYREVIRCVTEDKFHLADLAEIPEPGEPIQTFALDDAMGYRAMREGVKRAAEGAGMTGDAADDMVLAAGEAAANAIKHATAGQCALYLTDDRMIVRISDRGHGIQSDTLPATILMPGFSTQVSLGMGFTLMLELVDRVWLATSEEGTVVQVEKWLHPEDRMVETLAATLDRF